MLGDTETILRVGAFGCFVGHGWIAAMKLEFGGWSKFMAAAGFSEAEAHAVMPVIGWMDIALGAVTLLRPNQLCSAWMVSWAFNTALVRPFSAGWARASAPMSDNALWGFVERASNWACPLALLALQCADGYAAAAPHPALEPFHAALAPLDALCNGYRPESLAAFVVGAIGATWLVIVPLLRARRPRKK